MIMAVLSTPMPQAATTRADRWLAVVSMGGLPGELRQAIDFAGIAVKQQVIAALLAPDPHRGEIVKAFVHLRTGKTLTDSTLRAFLKDKLAPFEMPRQIEFRKALPKTLIGKIDKKALAREEPMPNLTPEEASLAS